MTEKKLVLKGKRTKNTAKGEITTLWFDNESVDWDYAIGLTIRGFKDEIEKFMQEHGLIDIGDKLFLTFKEDKKG